MDENYEDLLDEAEDQATQSDDLSDAQLESLEQTISQPREKADIYNWFWRVVRLGKPFQLVRAGNLSFAEIGENRVSVRDAMNLAKLGDIFHHETFAQYWEDLAGITSATSMAKKGWFLDLSISQRRIREKSKSGTPTFVSSGGKKKWRPFQSTKKEEQ